ncbi:MULTISPECIES: hypothetical protein [unclassified Neisseria]|uniref:hypothetical protein n=1 Tax=unclassified Neisseria TaxID=2623750 RepID=UPI0026671DF3|nr:MULTISPECIES: hypothetical protein [unclassified Neisseria]MDO1509728.1 hypothetical protein [Neisseria sp. MVDL19-042950]MDO1515948.1 hypothetical protein [Neisseria sp. MVDL18-041461]MDO1563061.1 hypothetical protein [Neisseria sp. MVDL20-010259]
MKTKLSLTALSVLLAACGEPAGNAVAPPQSETAASSVKAQAVSEVAQSGLTTDTDAERSALLAQFAAETREIERKLEKATPQEADELYERYEAGLWKENGVLSRLNDLDGQWLGDFYSAPYWKETERNLRPTALFRQRQRQAAAVGLEYVDVGEGAAVLRPQANYLPELFECCVSSDYYVYLNIKAAQDEQEAFSDAAVNVSWPELGNIIVKWERFLAEYPQSRLKKRAEQDYAFYAGAFLRGLDNTPTYSDDGTRVYPEYAAAWQYFIAANPDSPISGLLKKIRGKPRAEAFDIIDQYWRHHFGEPLSETFE